MKLFFALTLLFAASAQANKIEVLRTLDCKGKITLADGTSQVLALTITDEKEIFNLGGEDMDLFSSKLTMIDPVGVNKTLLSVTATDTDPQDTRDVKNEGGWKGSLYYSLSKTQDDLDASNYMGVLGVSSKANQVNQASRSYEVGLRVFGADENGADDVDSSGSVTCTVK